MYGEREPEKDIPRGTPGLDVPCNMGIIIIGLLYGAGDFGKSICLSANCGEDGDCTAATVGAILGIINGVKGIPCKWIEPIGEEIKTCSIDTTELKSQFKVPQTITELTNRVCSLMPTFLREDCDLMSDDGIILTLNNKDNLCDCEKQLACHHWESFQDFLKDRMMAIHFDNVNFETTITLKDSINIKNEQALNLKIKIKNNLRRQQWIYGRWMVPEEWVISNGKEFSVPLDQPHSGYGYEEFEVSIIPSNLSRSKYQILLELWSEGKVNHEYIPITLINSAIETR